MFCSSQYYISGPGTESHLSELGIRSAAIDYCLSRGCFKLEAKSLLLGCGGQSTTESLIGKRQVELTQWLLGVSPAAFMLSAHVSMVLLSP